MPSNLVQTVLQDYISIYTPRLDQHEQRPSSYSALNQFKSMTADPNSILDPVVMANIEKSFGPAVKVPVINYKDIAIGNARTCGFKTEGITSSMVTLTAVTYSFGFLIYPMQHYENYISYQVAINKLIDAGFQKLAATMDAGCVNVLETYKNQFWPQSMLNFYPEVGDAFQVPQAGKNDFYNALGSIIQTADFETGDVDVVTNPIGLTSVRRLAAQGEGNAVNEGFQLLGYTWYPTNRVTNGSGSVESTLYGITPGSVAIASRLDPDSKAQKRIHESKYWEQFPNAPYIGMDCGVFYQADCTDASAVQAAQVAGLTATSVESWQFSIDVFYCHAYNSDPVNRFGSVFKAEILA